MLHRAAGLTVRAGRPIPGLPVCQFNHQGSDVCVHLGASAPWSAHATRLIHTAEHVDESGVPLVRVGRNTFGFHFRYADLTQFWIDASGRDVWCTWPPEATLEDTATYLSGPVLGFILRLRGALALHASAVQVGGAALVLVGGHGAGKSTAAAALARRGCPVITDDVLHLRAAASEWLAEPFAAILRLWPHGGSLALGDGVELPRLTPGWDKRQLSVQRAGIECVDDAVPLGAIVWLEPRQDSPDVPRLDPISPSETLVRLAANSSASQLIDATLRAREFQAISDIAGRATAICATATANGDRFDAFITLIHDWAKAVTRVRRHATSAVPRGL